MIFNMGINGVAFNYLHQGNDLFNITVGMLIFRDSRPVSNLFLSSF